MTLRISHVILNAPPGALRPTIGYRKPTRLCRRSTLPSKWTILSSSRYGDVRILNDLSLSINLDRSAKLVWSSSRPKAAAAASLAASNLVADKTTSSRSSMPFPLFFLCSPLM